MKENSTSLFFCHAFIDAVDCLVEVVKRHYSQVAGKTLELTLRHCWHSRSQHARYTRGKSI